MIAPLTALTGRQRRDGPLPDLKATSFMSDPCLKMVLFTPEIPYDSGAIGWNCVALNLANFAAAVIYLAMRPQLGG